MSAYLGALAICLISVVLGAGICARPGGWTWTAPAVGLAATMLIALCAVRLPGHATAAVVLLAVALASSIVSVRRRRVDLRVALAGLPAGLVVLAFVSLPFIANERIGELGASQLDDLSFHLGQADAIREVGPAANVTASGYPIGPHSLVAVVAEGTGLGTASVFTGLLLAMPILTALTALAAFGGVSARLRTVGAVLVGLAYLPVAYFAEGGFKEPLLAMCLLGFALILREARAGARLSPAQLAGLIVTSAGGAAAFGITALVWPAVALAWFAILETIAGRGRLVRLPRPRWEPAWVLAGVAVAAVAAASLAASSGALFSSGPGDFFRDRGNGGNFIGQLSPFEALGIWPSADFRFTPTGRWYLAGVVIAVAVTLYGAIWCWRRRELALLAGALSGVSVYVAARPFTLAYFSGKALAVAAPIFTLIAVRALFAAEPGRERSKLARRVAWALVAGAFVLGAGYSSALALRGAHVRPKDRGPDLSLFRPIIRGEPTLYLGRDNFAGWELRGDRNVLGFQSNSSPLAIHLNDRPEKAGVFEPAVDVDSVDPGTLDSFRYLISPRTAFASQPPANFRVIRKSRWYLLWERRGPTGSRFILNESESPGATLECRAGTLRALEALAPAGVAFVRPKPVVGPADAWRRPDGSFPQEIGATSSGGSLLQRLRLGKGTWEISVRYFSDVPLHLRAGPITRTLPPYVADQASFWGVGRITTPGGPLTVRIDVPARRRPDIARFVQLRSMAATRVDRTGRVVPLKRACGKYVDWFGAGR